MPEDESSISTPIDQQDRHSARGSAAYKHNPQMEFGIADGEFRVPPTVIETSQSPSAFEKISQRLMWQEAKLGNHCAFFELGQEAPTEELPVATIFNGNNWQSVGEVSLITSPQQKEGKPPQFDAIVIDAGDFSKSYDQLAILLRSVRSRLGHNKPVYISIARPDGLGIQQLKHSLSKLVQGEDFIMPHILVGRKGKSEDMLVETRTEVRRHSTIPHRLASAQITEEEASKLEEERLKNRTPGEVRRESYAMALHHPDRWIANGEKCNDCSAGLSYLYHARPNPNGKGYLREMYLMCPADGKLSTQPVRSKAK